MKYNTKSTVIIDLRKQFSKTIKFNTNKLAVIDIEKQSRKLIRFILLLVALTFIGYQIGRDAAKRDNRLSSMKNEKSR